MLSHLPFHTIHCMPHSHHRRVNYHCHLSRIRIRPTALLPLLPPIPGTPLSPPLTVPHVHIVLLNREHQPLGKLVRKRDRRKSLKLCTLTIPDSYDPHTSLQITIRPYSGATSNKGQHQVFYQKDQPWRVTSSTSLIPPSQLITVIYDVSYL